MEQILENFIKLTKTTVPSGKEEKIFPLLEELCGVHLNTDKYGNRYTKIGISSTLFISHLDTVGAKETEVKHIITLSRIKTDGSTILGGDNKVGVAIMIEMIKHLVPGNYWFVRNEEIGCLGSSFIRDHTPEQLVGIKRAISFDRKERSSVITFMRNRRCCSDRFATELIIKLREQMNLPWHKDPTGVSADTASFIDIVPECTNISAGVWGEHTNNECIDTEWVIKLSKACIAIDWEGLRTYRDVSRNEAIPDRQMETIDQDDYNKIIYQENLKYCSISGETPTIEDLVETWNKYNPDDEVYDLSIEEQEEIYPRWKERFYYIMKIDSMMASFSFFPVHKLNLYRPNTYRYVNGNKKIVVSYRKDGSFAFNKYPIHSNKIAIRFIDSLLEKGTQLEIPLSTYIEINGVYTEIDDIELSKDEIKIMVTMDDKYKFYLYYTNSSKCIFRRYTKEKGQEKMLHDFFNTVNLEALKVALHAHSKNRLGQFIIPWVEPVYPKFKKKKKSQLGIEFDDINTMYRNTAPTFGGRVPNYHEDYYN